MKKYKVPVQYVFTGVFEVSAESKTDAMHKVKEDCAMTFGKVHSSLPTEEINWDFVMTPEEYVGKPKQIKE
jgi:hypothetical protein